jgi:hypothetical protein
MLRPPPLRLLRLLRILLMKGTTAEQPPPLGFSLLLSPSYERETGEGGPLGGE